MCTPTQRKLCGDEDCKICFDRSFASSEKSKYWDESNELKPINIFRGTDKKYKFKCGECDHVFEVSPNNISNVNQWCTYCKGHTLCGVDECKQCFDRSFASISRSKFWHKSNKKTPKDIFKNTHTKYKFKCHKCHHTFEMAPYNITSGNQWCPYCTPNTAKFCNSKKCDHCFKKSFASNKKSEFWAESNIVLPRYVTKNSGKKYEFICNKCDRIFKMSPRDINRGCWCPNCVNKTHKKLKDWLTDKIQFASISEKTFNWCKNKKTNRHYRFDEYLKEIKCVIELDGNQHFKQVSNWESNEETRQTDVYKMKRALKHEISIIRIYQEDVLKDKNKWRKKLRKAFKKVQESETPIVIYISSGNHYSEHKQDMGSEN